MKISNGSYYHKVVTKADNIEALLLKYAYLHISYGCRKLWQLLRLNGHIVNKKKICRLYKKHHLHLRLKRKVKIKRLKQPLIASSAPNKIWSIDFVYDKLDNGKQLKALTVIDEYNRELITIHVDSKITSSQLVKILNNLILIYGVPERIRSDNGPEFIAQSTQRWAQANNIIWLFIQPGKPTQNAFCERVNGTIRRELLNTTVFNSLNEARVLITEWVYDYNNNRPHDSLGGVPPVLYKQMANK